MAERVPVIHPEGGRKMVKQADKDKADINSVIAKWIRTGEPPVGGAHLQYGDFTNVGSYLEAQCAVIQARESFRRLPPHIRKYCENNPGKFLEMVYDPERRGELEELGLVEGQAPEDAPPAKEEGVGEETPTPPV